MKEKVTLDLILINGKRILSTFETEKIYCIEEKERIIMNFTKKFPFISFHSKRFTSFKYRTPYEIRDPKYKIDCSLDCFKMMLGLVCPSFEEISIKSMIVNGN